MAIAPPRLRAGDTLGIVAPAGPIRQLRLERGLERLGDTFRIQLAPSLVSSGRDATMAGPPRAEGLPSFLASADEQRAAELSAMLANPDIRAIILARGGYGIMRILPLLDPALLRADPKPIVGFSDGTALLAWAHHAGVRSIHGPVVAQLADLPVSDATHLFEMLTSPAPVGERPWTLAVHAEIAARLTGPLVPANLTLASLLHGTPWAVPLAQAIALFEEVGERPYELDRYLTHLSLVGALAQTQAVVLGDLTRCEDHNPATGEKDPPDAALATVIERVRAVHRPVAVGAPVGHGTRNESVVFGAACELDLSRGSLAILDAAVA